VRRIGIDVGGTNTDAVLLEDGRVVHAVKTPTTEDVTGGIVTSLELLGRHPEVATGAIDGVVIGTTHFINGETDQIYRDMTREAAIAAAEAQAVASGADRASLQTIEIEDIPLAYLPGNAIRVRVRVAGEIGSPE
jgi:N-methylhydantoinase A/oxoprolinase/acetone carboxylase beta subunit